jgi:hypothetical protein
MISKRPFLLLEVLIAFALIALCALPLLYPHVMILKKERAFISSVKLDHTVSLLYAGLLEKLYKREVRLADILGEKSFPIDEGLDFLPYTGSYRFVEEKHKPPHGVENPLKKTIYLFNVHFSFEPKNKREAAPIEYCYNVMIESKHE